MNLRSLLGLTASSVLTLALAACGGGGGSSTPATFLVGGSITGLSSGQTVTVLNNGGDAKTVTGGGSGTDTFTFATSVTAGGNYAVTISTQPANEVCSVSGASGSGSGINANITTITLACSNDTYSISGNVTGLASGQKVVLLNNGADSTTVTGAGTGTDAFTFATKVAYKGSYTVTVGTQPANQTCSISGATGTGSGVNGNVSSVTLACSGDTYNIGGTITGLASGQVVTLLNNGGDAKTVTGGGSGSDNFTFATPVAYLGSYAVTVSTQPLNQVCSVSGASGTGSGVNTDVSAVTLACSNDRYAISGTISGLAQGDTVTLLNNGADATTVTGGGSGTDSFNFAAKIPYLGGYAVTVSTQPAGKTCSASGGTGSGSGVNADVPGVTLVCSGNTYTISGTISNLALNQTVTLLDNGADAKSITGTGTGTDAFVFATPIPYLGGYAVTVSGSPTNQTCTISANGSAMGVNANVTGVALTCSNDTYAISGTISNLALNETVTLLNNGADPQTITGGGTGTDAFAFTTRVSWKGMYAVTVGTQPTHQTCSPTTNGSASNVAANVTTVGLTCSSDTYAIGGTVTGLAAGQTVTLLNNGADPQTVTGGGSGSDPVNFTPVAWKGGYTVTISTSPTAEVCHLSNATGTNVAANIANIGVTCRLEIAYVTNSNDGTVSQFKVNPDGSLVQLAAPITTGSGAGSGPQKVIVDPTGKFAFVANSNDNTVSEFAIADNGTLSLFATVNTDAFPYGLAIASTVNGNFLYVTTQTANTVNQFAIGGDGTLTAITSTTPVTGVHPYNITVDPAGQHVYVANLGSSNTKGHTVSEYLIGADGSLNELAASPVDTVGLGPLGIAIDPTGTYAYVTNFFDLTIGKFTFDGTGNLVATLGAPLTTLTGPYPLAITADGHYGYYAEKNDDQVEQCAFVAQGALDCSAGPVTTVTTTTTTPAQPRFVVIDPLGTHAYAVNFGGAGPGTVAQYAIGGNGALTPITTTAPTAGSGSFSIAITK